MLDRLLHVVQEVEKNDDKIVIITGQGKAFSAGGDIAMMSDFANKPFFDHVMQTIEKIVLTLYQMPKIIISASNGSVAGLGLSLALTADYVIADQTTKMGMLFIGIGLAPDGGGHFWMEERLGIQQAKQFIWNREQVNATKAKTMGLVDIVAEEDALQHAIDLGKKLLCSPLESMLQTKMLYHQTNIKKLTAYLQKEQEIQWHLVKTVDHEEGVQAFLEKRKPAFIGK